MFIGLTCKHDGSAIRLRLNHIVTYVADDGGTIIHLDKEAQFAIWDVKESVEEIDAVVSRAWNA